MTDPIDFEREARRALRWSRFSLAFSIFAVLFNIGHGIGLY